jgi:glyoxylate/hydroxypyruvate reductase
MSIKRLKPINLVFYSKWDSYEKWKTILIKQNIKLFMWPKDFNINTLYPNINGALVWDPPEDMWQSFPNIKIIQSLGAGVDHILRKPFPKNVHLLKLNDPNLSNQMAEYVLMSVLMCHRKFFQYTMNKQKKDWDQLIPLDKKKFTITLLGYGTIAKLVIKKLLYMGFNIKAWGKTKRHPKNIKYYYGAKQLKNSIKDSSCLISLLPATSNTNNIIGLAEFKLLNKECYFVNVGRGNTVNEKELIHALSYSILTGAILDVFNKEPLNKTSKLWTLNNVYITPHIAGITNATDYAACLLKKNFEALNQNKKLSNTVNNTNGY